MDCAVTDIMGWQSTTIAAGGDAVEYGCNVTFYGDANPRFHVYIGPRPHRTRLRRSRRSVDDEPRTSSTALTTFIPAGRGITPDMN